MTDIWDSIAGNSTAILQSLMGNEVRTSLAIILVLTLEQVRKSWNPRLRYALWLVVLFQALWPPTFRIPTFTVWPVTPVQLLPTGLVAGSSSAAVLPGGINSTVWILALWGAASVMVILWMAVAFFDLRWKLRGAQLLDDSPPIIETLATRWKPSLLVSHRIHSPLAIGLFQPKIYLTPAAAQMDEHTLRAILSHETAHILRLDRWVICLQVLALILHPFNPLVWLMNRRLARYREQICDDFALQHTDIAPVTYGHLLLDYVAQGVFNRPTLLPRTLFCESRNDLRQRLTQLLSRKETTMNRTSILQKLSLTAILLAMVFISSQCQATGARVRSAPPASPAETEMEFVPYDEPPKPVGGFSAIGKALAYPEEAKAKGITGMVQIYCQVLADGRTGKVTVADNETGDKSLADAAVAAVSQITWIPAKQEGESVSVWVTIPIDFSLNDKPSSVKEED
jgi:TonB family protein